MVPISTDDAFPPSAVRTPYDDLLVDVVDVHVHVDQEFSDTQFRKIAPEWTWLPEAEAAGVAAVVLKSHLWPSTALLPMLRQLYRGSVQVIPSVTLNPTSGGVEPWAVEAAAAMGARVVFLPTWGSAADRRNGGFHARLAAAFDHFDPARLSTLSLVADDGALSDATQQVLRQCAEGDLVLGTGHCDWRESLLLCQEARRIGYERLIFNHPLSASVKAPREAIVEAASLGAAVEICWTNIAPGRVPPVEVVSVVEEIGADRTVLSSDFFGGNNPMPHQLLRLFLGTLLDSGMSAATIRTATVDVPRRLLGVSAA